MSNLQMRCIERPDSRIRTSLHIGGAAAPVAPDARLSLLGAGGQTLSRCSLWWRGTPRLQGSTVGLIGHYAARDAESAACLLEEACTRLAARGHTLAVGPVNGSTWMRYRFVVERGSKPPFFLEPDNPPESPAQFENFGFETLALYRSRVQENLFLESTRLARADARLRGLGVRIRGLDTRRMTQELQCIHALSLECFSDALLFSPITVDAFIARYRLLMPHIDPRLVLLAEHQGRLVGYLFALPDARQSVPGADVDTVILKTVAVAPGRCYAGLGHVLAMHAAARARTLGYTRAIHALMREGGGSANWSAQLGRPLRRYALFAKTLHDRH
ncbi:MAG: N-acetyltransferase [Gammaproteobacteria bacterium]|nr:N-acetyltransferase [Gammaproteobacteria bacterium]NIR84787.1 N-acetyltransferase [Gammaproteobacteria bacterium]NIR91306.1 N-acetyltransferase [Gammaproteobacteria bacterium]NIU05834.1 N-acetyltransferase [Gammaproteobacteria bacterium]NIV76494.1 N-acetyltransferase [Gammaproteobacteria bacterium]